MLFLLISVLGLPYRTMFFSGSFKTSHPQRKVFIAFLFRFEGGAKAHEFVSRLYIQCCSPASPAARNAHSTGRGVISFIFAVGFLSYNFRPLRLRHCYRPDVKNASATDETKAA
jgi:hypothetical protein